MIRHIVFFSAKDPQDVDSICDGLWALGEIPGSIHFEVAVNTKIDQLRNDIDVVVYAEFPDEAAFAAYKAHPIYAATTAKVRPMRELRFAADFVAQPRRDEIVSRPRALSA